MRAPMRADGTTLRLMSHLVKTVGLNSTRGTKVNPHTVRSKAEIEVEMSTTGASRMTYPF